MKFGIQVGHLGGPLDELRRLWRFADEQGFEWFSVSDHFQETPGHGGTGPCLDSIAMLTAAAVETQRVRVGCLVFSVSYRMPIVLAKAMTTIDLLSGGRVTCGLGAGWHEPEYRAYGIPFPSAGVREDQLEEYTQLLRLLFDEPFADFAGRHYTLEHAPNFPKPVQRRLPIWIGGGGEKRTLRTAARYADGWNVPYLSPAEWAAKNAVLDRWCEDLGRDPTAIARSVNVGFYLGVDAAGAARAQARFAQEWGANDARTGFLRGEVRRAGDAVAAYRDAGAEQLNIALRAGPYDWDALAAFARDVMPAFR
ncbi:MAG: TIGR03560 family F420-dependent LLM class oxidoreductase [Chloroflexota bacterium]|nr:TIGR03560 family F420-dependent LLM class oxidoreductase [Chloroflexota bacterium]